MKSKLRNRNQSTIKYSLIFVWLFGIFIHGCKKEEIREGIQRNGLNSHWSLHSKIRDPWWISGNYSDTIQLQQNGLYCNLEIDDKGVIDVFEGNDQDSKIAVWRITEINGVLDTIYNLEITVKMIDPNRSKKNATSYFIREQKSQLNARGYLIFLPNCKSNEQILFFSNKLLYDYNSEYFFYKN